MAVFHVLEKVGLSMGNSLRKKTESTLSCKLFFSFFSAGAFVGF